MKKLVAFVLTCLSVVSLAYSQQDPKAKEILDKMSQKYQSIHAFTAQFTQQLENKMEKVSDSFSGKITVMGDMYYADMNGQEIINNGKTVWTYMKDANEVTIDNYDPDNGGMNPSKIYTAYKQGYKYVYLAGEGNAKFHVIDLVPEDKNSQFYKVRMKIKKDDLTLDSWTIFDRAGNVYTYKIDDFKIRKDITASFFQFDKSKHPGVEVLDFR